MREVEVPQDDRVYRARIESGASPLRRRPRWRYVIEGMWTAIPADMREGHHWRSRERGRWHWTEDKAREAATAWLDKAEGRAASNDDYVG